MADLTGQNIQDTYQRLLQTDGGTLRDGTGSLVTLTNITASGDISASGDLLLDGKIEFGGDSEHKIERKSIPGG